MKESMKEITKEITKESMKEITKVQNYERKFVYWPRSVNKWSFIY